MVIPTICRLECFSYHLHHELCTVVGKLTIVCGCVVCHVYDVVHVEHVEDADVGG